MAVYTQVSAEQLAALLTRFDLGELISAKGIAEGVENSNYIVDTTQSRLILTLYEKRVDVADLPFFLAMLDHLADRGLPVPRAFADRGGRQVQEVAGRPACLIEFLPGVSVSAPTPAQAAATGAALGSMHAALQDFTLERPNALGCTDWRPLADRCGADLDAIAPGLRADIAGEIDWLENAWPTALPRSAIHADLFPDNVLMLGDHVAGIIDFYFACTDVRAWDLAVTHSAWCFAADGTGYDPTLGSALVRGYRETFALSEMESAAFLTLARGSCVRFLLTRAWDWLNTPADALVTRKDPMAFHRRLQFYRNATPQEIGL